MGWPVVIVESGGIPVTEATNRLGTPVTVAVNGLGAPVSVVASRGIPVVGTPPSWVPAADVGDYVANISLALGWDGPNRRAVPLTDWINGGVISGALLTALQASAFSWILEASTTVGATQAIVQVDDGTNNNRVIGYVDSAGVANTRLFVGGVSAGNSFTANSITSNVPFKIAAGVSGSVVNVALNGGAAVSIAHALDMPARTAGRYASSLAGAAPFTGTIQKITVKPEAVLTGQQCTDRSA